MTSKRYVLLEAEGEVTPDEWRGFADALKQRFGKLKVIAVEGSGRAVVVKTDNLIAPRIREVSPEMRVGCRRVASVLTSGSIGKLKRRARESAVRDLGEVPQ